MIEKNLNKKRKVDNKLSINEKNENKTLDILNKIFTTKVLEINPNLLILMNNGFIGNHAFLLKNKNLSNKLIDKYFTKEFNDLIKKGNPKNLILDEYIKDRKKQDFFNKKDVIEHFGKIKDNHINDLEKKGFVFDLKNAFIIEKSNSKLNNDEELIVFEYDKNNILDKNKYLSINISFFKVFNTLYNDGIEIIGIDNKHPIGIKYKDEIVGIIMPMVYKNKEIIDCIKNFTFKRFID